jgi:hypothetical protein
LDLDSLEFELLGTWEQVASFEQACHAPSIRRRLPESLTPLIIITRRGGIRRIRTSRIILGLRT